MPKVYQILEPFEDPEKEKKRQNAIKAKEARDRKNAEVLGLKKTIEKLQRIKRKQRKSLDQYKIILNWRGVIPCYPYIIFGFPGGFGIARL